MLSITLSRSVRRLVRRREVEVVKQSAQVVEHVTEVILLVVRIDVVVKVAEHKVTEQLGFGLLCGVDDELDFSETVSGAVTESTRRLSTSRRSDCSGRVDDEVDVLGGGAGSSGGFDAQRSGSSWSTMVCRLSCTSPRQRLRRGRAGCLACRAGRREGQRQRSSGVVQVSQLSA